MPKELKVNQVRISTIKRLANVKVSASKFIDAADNMPGAGGFNPTDEECELIHDVINALILLIQDAMSAKIQAEDDYQTCVDAQT